MAKYFFLFCILSSIVAGADQMPAFADQAPVFLDVVKDDVGNIKFMSQEDAVQYCASQGNHLPSPRELVQLEMTRGAEGIVQACVHDPNHSDEFINWDQCSKVAVADRHYGDPNVIYPPQFHVTQGDTFFYSWKGVNFDNNYKPRLLWTSAAVLSDAGGITFANIPQPQEPYEPLPVIVYAMDMTDGSVQTLASSKDMAVDNGIGVRCVKGR